VLGGKGNRKAGFRIADAITTGLMILAVLIDIILLIWMIKEFVFTFGINWGLLPMIAGWLAALLFATMALVWPIASAIMGLYAKTQAVTFVKADLSPHRYDSTDMKIFGGMIRAYFRKVPFVREFFEGTALSAVILWTMVFFRALTVQEGFFMKEPLHARDPFDAFLAEPFASFFPIWLQVEIVLVVLAAIALLLNHLPARKVMLRRLHQLAEQEACVERARPCEGRTKDSVTDAVLISRRETLTCDPVEKRPVTTMEEPATTVVVSDAREPALATVSTNTANLPSQSASAPQKRNVDAQIGAKFFMVYGTVASGWAIIPLFWCIPMTVTYFRKVKKGEPISVAFKICSCLFVSGFGGAIMFADPN